jgi:hypothetical protein
MRLFISPSFGLMHAGEWPGFISGASIHFAAAKVFATEGFRNR